MAFKLSKGSRNFGDIKFEDDSDTGIDFEADTVKLETNGQERLVVGNTGAQLNGTLKIQETNGVSNLLELDKAENEVSEIAFLKNGTEYASIYMNSYENLIISVQQENSSRQFSVRAGNEEAFNINGSTKKIRMWQDNSPEKEVNMYGQVNVYNQLVVATPNSAFADSTLDNGSCTFYLDESNNKLMIKVKYSDGVVKSGTIDLV